MERRGCPLPKPGCAARLSSPHPARMGRREQGPQQVVFRVCSAINRIFNNVYIQAVLLSSSDDRNNTAVGICLFPPGWISTNNERTSWWKCKSSWFLGRDDPNPTCTAPRWCCPESSWSTQRKHQLQISWFSRIFDSWLLFGRCNCLDQAHFEWPTRSSFVCDTKRIVELRLKCDKFDLPQGTQFDIF